MDENHYQQKLRKLFENSDLITTVPRAREDSPGLNCETEKLRLPIGSTKI